MIRELDVVALTHDIPEQNLKEGDSGAVIHCYKNSQTEENVSFEVEFVSNEGSTIALLTLGLNDIEPTQHEVFLYERRITLTSTEFRLLYLLVKNEDTVVTHQSIEQFLWATQGTNSKLVVKYVERLRKKIGDNARDPSWIANVHGVGYRFIGKSSTTPPLVLSLS